MKELSSKQIITILENTKRSLSNKFKKYKEIERVWNNNIKHCNGINHKRISFLEYKINNAKAKRNFYWSCIIGLDLVLKGHYNYKIENLVAKGYISKKHYSNLKNRQENYIDNKFLSQPLKQNKDNIFQR